jgi:DNA invertase Pin-like site-specific DNA recombinase
MENIQKFVAYYRVSTDRQGKSGLGLDAQKEHVKIYVESTHSDLIEHFVEVESGRKSDRPMLKKALDLCRKIGAVLLIAKLDRLARKVHFISGLMESGVQFRAADMPNADRFMLHVYAAMAEEEARRISERTKQALKAAKLRGVRLGTTASVLAKRHSDDANKFALLVGPTIESFKLNGLSIRKIASCLNCDKIRSHHGGDWHPTTVQRVWKRYKELKIIDTTTGKIPNPLCQTS